MKKYVLFILGVLALVLYQASPANALLIESSRSWNMPLVGQVIVIDPGHGGVDGGAVGNETIIEKDITLKISHKLKGYLEGQGAHVILTRSNDTDLAPTDLKGYSRRKAVDLRKRVEIVNKSNAFLFLSIHLNALPVRSVHGAQTFYHPVNEQNKALANDIQERLIENFHNAKKDALPIRSVYLLKYSKPTGALVEVGFLSNSEEREKLAQDEYQEKLAAAIYQGIIKYYMDYHKEAQ